MSGANPLEFLMREMRERLEGIEGLTVYDAWPAPKGAKLPCAVITLINGRWFGGYPDDLQFFEGLLQVDVWARDPAGARALADAIIDKIYRSRVSPGVLDLRLVHSATLPFEEEGVEATWRMVLDFLALTTITK